MTIQISTSPKNTKNGFSLQHCRSFDKNRLSVALLIATLAAYVLWVLGIAAKQNNLHYSFQANTERKKNILSCFSIGWQILEKNILLPFSSIKNATLEIICASY